jgi:hypothetical protein
MPSSFLNRTVTLQDLAHYFEVPVGRLERIVMKHRIDPAYKLGRVRAYGPAEARAINRVLNP